MPRRVTPDGVRSGVPEALAGLVELRGSAVRAYAGALAPPEDALAAAAEAMAGFRSHVVQAADMRDLNPDSVLLRAVRESSAARARRPTESGGGLRRIARRADSACELVPRLLAARANRELSHDDAARLDRHLASCPQCLELRERFRTAERLYAEAAGAPLAEHDARALLVALAGAGPLSGGTPQSIAEDALALLPAEAVSRPAPPTRPPDPWPTDPAATDPRPAPPTRAPDPWPTDPPATDVRPQPPTRPPDPWPTDPPATNARPAPNAERSTARDGQYAVGANGAGASPAPTTAQHGARVGTTPGRVSFGRRTVTIRSGIQRSGPAAPPVEREPEPPEPEPPAPEPEHPAVAAAPEPEPPAPPAAPEPDPAPDEARHEAPAPVPPAAIPIHVRVPAAHRPGAPPDSGTLARVVPGVLIVMAIGIALLVAGIVGADNTPATTDDIDPPSLREPARELDTTGTPPAPGSDAADDTN